MQENDCRRVHQYEDNRMKKLTAFLKKTHFFATCIHLLWSLTIVAFSIFGGYHDLNFYIPDILVGICVILIGMTGIFIWYRLFTSEQKKSAIILYQIFYYAIPIAFSIGKVIFCGSLYHFGGFMPGLDELGFVVTALLTGIAAILGCIIFWIVFWVKKRRRCKALPQNTVLREKLCNAANILSFFAIVIALAAFAVSYGSEEFLIFIRRQEAAKNEAYLEEVLSSIPAMQGAGNSNELLLDEALTYMKTTEYLALNEGTALTGRDLSIGSFSHIQKEVLEAGRADYLEFAARYQIPRGVEMLNQEILGNARDETVSVSSELYMIDPRDQTDIHGCMIVTFDREWNVIRINCSELPLIRYMPYSYLLFPVSM